MGVHDFETTFTTLILPGSAQLRDGSTFEGWSLAIGSGAALGLCGYEIARFLGERSTYGTMKSDYLKASTEADALQLHYSLAQQYSTVARHRNLAVGFGLVLGAFLTYNVIDVFWNHGIVTNILEPGEPDTGLRINDVQSERLFTVRVRF